MDGWEVTAAQASALGRWVHDYPGEPGVRLTLREDRTLDAVQGDTSITISADGEYSRAAKGVTL